MEQRLMRIAPVIWWDFWPNCSYSVEQPGLTHPHTRDFVK